MQRFNCSLTAFIFGHCLSRFLTYSHCRRPCTALWGISDEIMVSVELSLSFKVIIYMSDDDVTKQVWTTEFQAVVRLKLHH